MILEELEGEPYKLMEFQGDYYITPKLFYYLAVKVLLEAEEFKEEYRERHNIDCDLGIVNIFDIVDNIKRGFGNITIRFAHKPKYR